MFCVWKELPDLVILCDLILSRINSRKYDLMMFGIVYHCALAPVWGMDKVNQHVIHTYTVFIVGNHVISVTLRNIEH